MPRATKADVAGNFDEELAKVLKNPPKQRCVVKLVIDEHPNGPDIQAALDNPRWTAPQLANVLSKHLNRGFRPEIITKHRNGTCTCER